MKTKAFLDKKFIWIILAISIVLGLFCRFHIVSVASEAIPVYSGTETVEINGNEPLFTAEEITTTSFETYGKLDSQGRCTAAIACVGQDIMPTEERGAIGNVKPTGWKQNKYPGVVNSNPPYLYNRCHLIGYQLTGENANTQNLITGTRYMNVEGMLPYENLVADYVNTTGNHVMYRVTPVFSGKNLLCSGVRMEAYSVEDDGKGVSFHVFCHNVQPGVIINYSDGSNSLDTTYSSTKSQNTTGVTKQNTISNTTTDSVDYIANKNTKKFHYPTCSSVKDMKEKNKWYYQGNRSDLIDKGYSPCKRCNP